MNDTDLVAKVQSKAQESRASVTPYSFGELANMYANKELIIDPDYQRLFRWSDEKQSQFIESLMLELPVPPLFMIQREDETYELADGLQRMSTYLRFVGGFKKNQPQETELLERVKEDLILGGCDIVKELNGRNYESLPTALAIRLRRSRIDCAITKIGSDPNLRYHIFKRLNTGGEKLSAHEARSSFTRMLSPQWVDFIIALSKNLDFVSCIESITDYQREQRFDQELVLRFLAFYMRSNDFKHEIDPFLTEFFEALARDEYKEDELVRIFEQTFNALAGALGSQAFTLEGRDQFSALHFEGIAIATANLIHRKELGKDLKRGVMELKADRDFQEVAKGGGKNSAGQFRKRVEIAEKYLR